LTCSPNKRLALEIFVAPRPLADKHQLGARIAHAKNQVGPPRTKFAPAAIADFST